MKALTPNESWQPTPVGRHAVFPASLARRGCPLRYAETEYIRKSMSIMKRNRSVVVLIAVSSMLLAGCCSVHHADKWEYKVTQVPGAPEETANMRGPSLEERERYLNTLGNDGWILVSEDQAVFYLKRPEK